MKTKHPKFKIDAEGNLWCGFGAYGEEVEVAALSRDARRLLLVRDVDLATIWDTSTGEQIGELKPISPLEGQKARAPSSQAFRTFIESAALSADGSLALLGLNDGSALLYNTKSNKLIATLRQAPEPCWSVIRAVAFSPDDRLALVGFPKRTVGVWTKDGSEQVALLSPSNGHAFVARPTVRDTLFTSVAASSDGSLIFAGASDMTACVFELKSTKTLLDAQDHAADQVVLFDAPFGIGWATTNGALWLAEDGITLTKVLETGESWSEVIVNNGYLLARSVNGTISRWTFDGERQVLSGPETSGLSGDCARTLHLRPGVTVFPRGGHEVVIKSQNTEVRETSIHREDEIVHIDLSSAGDRIATSGWWSKNVNLHLADTGALLSSFPSAGGPRCFAFDPRRDEVAVVGPSSQQLHFYESRTGAPIRTQALSGKAHRLLYSDDGRFLVGVGPELSMWDLDSSRKGDDLVLRVPLAGRVEVTFAQDRLVVLDQGGCRVFEEARLASQFEVPMSHRTRSAISLDGTHLLIGSDQSVLRFCLSDGTLKRKLTAELRRPEVFPSDHLADAHGVRVGALLWRVGEHAFLHQGGGPRGWRQPIQLSEAKIAVTPTASGSAVFSVDRQGVRYLGDVAFEGTLRASRITEEEVLLVNERGVLFRSRRPDV